MKTQYKKEKSMQYIVMATITSTIEIIIHADNEAQAQINARKIPLSDWDVTSEKDFQIHHVEECEL
jgi:hypothetical protein